MPAREAEDIAQEVFIVVHRRAATFIQASAPRRWLYVITSFVAGNRCKLARNQREVPCAFIDEVLDEALVSLETPESSYAEAEQVADLRRRVDGLRTKLRVVVEKYVFEGRPMEDVAAALALPVKTAQARLILARNELMRLKDTRHFGKS